MIRYIITALVFLLILFGIPEPAYADNCSSLSDCYGVAIAAAIAGVAIPILISLLLDFSPLGRAKGILEAIIGRDLITGDQLAWWERLLNLIPGGRIESKAAKSTNALDVVKNLIRDERGAVKVADEAGDAARATNKLENVAKGNNITRDLAKVDDKTSDIVKVEQWRDLLPKKPTPNNTAKDAFEIKHTGAENFLVSGGGEKVWADGIRPTNQSLLEAKYINNPDRSPFIPTSECPNFVRDTIIAKVDEEFRRYGAVIADPATPVKNLEVIINDLAAKPFFESLMEKYSIPGHVIVP